MSAAAFPPAWTEGGAHGRPSAHATTLGPAFDLLAAYRPIDGGSGPAFFFERGGLGVAGIGGPRVPVAAGPDRFAEAAQEVRRALSSIGAPALGPGPLVAGAFAFVDGGAASLWVLTRCVRRARPGESWQVEVTSPGEETWGPAGERRPGPGRPSGPFDERDVRSDPPGSMYADEVATAVERIRAGDLAKVVLARSMVVDAGRRLDVGTLLWRLRAVDPDCFTFAVPTPSGTMVGATPELLVSRDGRRVRATPLAGSAPRFGDPGQDLESAGRLLASLKDRIEHAIVADAVESALSPFCERLDRDPEPAVLGTANVWHLSTRFEGRLREPAPSVLELVGALHPTPAVCGEPREAALRMIRELEPFDRGVYAGPVGWVDADGNGEWALALRCAEIRGREVRLFAGAGIVADSDPEAELDETERKFRALLDSLRWG